MVGGGLGIAPINLMRYCAWFPFELNTPVTGVKDKFVDAEISPAINTQYYDKSTEKFFGGEARLTADHIWANSVVKIGFAHYGTSDAVTGESPSTGEVVNTGETASYGDWFAQVAMAKYFSSKFCAGAAIRVRDRHITYGLSSPSMTDPTISFAAALRDIKGFSLEAALMDVGRYNFKFGYPQPTEAYAKVAYKFDKFDIYNIQGSAEFILNSCYGFPEGRFLETNLGSNVTINLIPKYHTDLILQYGVRYIKTYGGQRSHILGCGFKFPQIAGRDIGIAFNAAAEIRQRPGNSFMTSFSVIIPLEKETATPAANQTAPAPALPPQPQDQPDSTSNQPSQPPNQGGNH